MTRSSASTKRTQRVPGPGPGPSSVARRSAPWDRSRTRAPEGGGDLPGSDPGCPSRPRRISIRETPGWPGSLGRCSWESPGPDTWTSSRSELHRSSLFRPNSQPPPRCSGGRARSSGQRTATGSACRESASRSRPAQRCTRIAYLNCRMQQSSALTRPSRARKNVRIGISNTAPRPSRMLALEGEQLTNRDNRAKVPIPGRCSMKNFAGRWAGPRRYPNTPPAMKKEGREEDEGDGVSTLPAERDPGAMNPQTSASRRTKGEARKIAVRKDDLHVQQEGVRQMREGERLSPSGRNRLDRLPPRNSYTGLRDGQAEHEDQHQATTMTARIKPHDAARPGAAESSSHPGGEGSVIPGASVGVCRFVGFRRVRAGVSGRRLAGLAVDDRAGCRLGPRVLPGRGGEPRRGAVSSDSCTLPSRSRAASRSPCGALRNSSIPSADGFRAQAPGACGACAGGFTGG